MKKSTLLVISIIYNIVVYGVSLGGLYLKEQEEGEITADMFLSYVGPAFPLMIIGLIMAGVAVSPDRDGGNKVNKKSVIFAIILSMGFLAWRFGMSMLTGS